MRGAEGVHRRGSCRLARSRRLLAGRCWGASDTGLSSWLRRAERLAHWAECADACLQVYVHSHGPWSATRTLPSLSMAISGVKLRVSAGCCDRAAGRAAKARTPEPPEARPLVAPVPASVGLSATGTRFPTLKRGRSCYMVSFSRRSAEGREVIEIVGDHSTITPE